ncbi:TetR/AcrR family transcriptional regulator [Planomonospora parontospora]|uniref:TetR/AcrR family transcriptional regulator n=1 Tax=Planomonospora parontospora TaxID=58119 RepID=UPI0016714834|nr:TetR/AcrR family transcriptional regulator [Planomonospora parontospora]GGL41360.1 TetR family transcriptional regulator [Planomonospora parontospora subsp. antibiotica]GII17958.1 TetR family transcriptional regulator [Planomonospora parontospora subsp. antibiotica]
MDGLDRRVRRTRRAVQDALVDAIVDKGYDAVTVTDLIERADIGRSTFYSHFTGKQDVLFHTIDELVDRLGSARPTAPEEMFAFSLPLLEHVDEQRHLVRALLGPRGGAAVHARIRYVLSSIIRAELLTALPPDTRAPADLDLAVTCAAGAFMALLTRWVEDGTAETPARMDTVFRTVLTKGVAAALEGAPSVEQQPSAQRIPVPNRQPRSVRL